MPVVGACRTLSTHHPVSIVLRLRLPGVPRRKRIPVGAGPGRAGRPRTRCSRRLPAFGVFILAQDPEPVVGLFRGHPAAAPQDADGMVDDRPVY